MSLNIQKIQNLVLLLTCGYLKTRCPNKNFIEIVFGSWATTIAKKKETKRGKMNFSYG